jgi:hypothetical protein
MIEIMNHIKVLLKSTGKPDYFTSQNDECVTALKIIPIDEIIMGQVQIADLSDKAPATKGIDALKYYQGYNHVSRIQSFLQETSLLEELMKQHPFLLSSTCHQVLHLF